MGMMKTDCVLQSRCKSTTLATIAKFLHEQGFVFLNNSMLVRIVLDEFANVLIDNGAEPIEDVTKAFVILDNLGIVTNTSGRGLRNKFLNLKLQDRTFRPRPATQQIHGRDFTDAELRQAVEDHWKSTGQTPPQPNSSQVEPTYTQADVRASLEKQDQDLEQLKALDDVSLAPMVERETTE